MKEQTFGRMITVLRKEKGMTQLDLAKKMGVTDKAVSKWERDLSFPDISAIPKLAGIFGVTVDELMQVKANSTKTMESNKISQIINLAFKGVALAMGIAVVVFSFIGDVETIAAVRMLGIGLACLSITLLPKKEDK